MDLENIPQELHNIECGLRLVRGFTATQPGIASDVEDREPDDGSDRFAVRKLCVLHRQETVMDRKFSATTRSYFCASPWDYNEDVAEAFTDFMKNIYDRAWVCLTGFLQKSIIVLSVRFAYRFLFFHNGEVLEWPNRAAC